MSGSTIRKPCLHCEEPFDAPLREVNRGNGKFCCQSCSSKYHAAQRRKAKKPNVECAYCGKAFYKTASKRRASKSGLHFCCREHKDLAQRIEFGLEAIHPDHYGDAANPKAYREIAFRNHPAMCNRCGYCEHKEVLVVHHKDRDRTNNDPENLEILCPTCHQVDHFLAGDGRFSAPCKSEREFDPDPATLENLMWKMPVRDVAQKLGTSTTTLRKRCVEHSINTPPLGYWAKKENK